MYTSWEWVLCFVPCGAHGWPKQPLDRPILTYGMSIRGLWICQLHFSISGYMLIVYFKCNSYSHWVNNSMLTLEPALIILNNHMNITPILQAFKQKSEHSMTTIKTTHYISPVHITKKNIFHFLLGNFLDLHRCVAKVFCGPILLACLPLTPGLCNTDVDCYSQWQKWESCLDVSWWCH